MGLVDLTTLLVSKGGNAAQDSEATITLSYADAFNGVQKRFNLGNETIDVRIPAEQNLVVAYE